jgi:hypothetical protein
MEFKKAALQEVDPKPTGSGPPKLVEGTKIEVQINPASLRLQMANSVDSGKGYGRPSTQYQGTASSTLSFDLVFDTADEGNTDIPVDVRSRTRQLERYLLPTVDKPKSAPPRVQFSYGTLTVVGVMTSLNQDFDLFSMNGVPLRAKCAVTIKEQKPEFDAKLVGPGANTGAGATPPLGPAARTGAGTGQGAAGPAPPPPPPPPDRTGTALDGESAADFANRMGLDPRAWKGLAEDLPDPLRLEAGQQIDFSSALSADAGLSVQLGATAGPPGDADPGSEAAPATAVPAQVPADGAGLTAQGGLTRVIDRVAATRVDRAAARTRAAFEAPPDAPVAAPAPGRPAAPAVAAGAGAVDARSLGYGFGVPLRARRGVAGTVPAALVHERRRGVHQATGTVPETDDPTVPAWRALPAEPAAPAGRHGPGSGGGCGCGCASGEARP